MSWYLVTEPDELERCCVVIDEVRCGQRTAFKVEPTDPAQRSADDYAYVCGDHVELVRELGDVATPLLTQLVTAR